MLREIYLDEAATSRYKPSTVFRAVTDAMNQSANPGRSGHAAALNAAMKVENCRTTVREILGDGEVVFTKNCTEALNLGILGIRPKGIVLSTVFEHNSVLRPLKFLEELGQITPLFVSPYAGFVLKEEDFEKALAGRIPSFMVCSEQSNVTGVRQDLNIFKAIANKYGIPLLIDAAQSMGHGRGDYSGCMVATSGHKGLHGPQGTGFLWTPLDCALHPILFGGTGTDSISLTQPTRFPEGFESGTLNTPGIAGLDEGMQWTVHNLTEIENRTLLCAERLYQGLSNIKGVKIYSPPNSTVISFNLRNWDSTELANALNEQFRIAVRGGLHCAPLTHRFLKTEDSGTVRASIGFHNTPIEIDRMIASVYTLSYNA